MNDEWYRDETGKRQLWPPHSHPDPDLDDYGGEWSIDTDMLLSRINAKLDTLITILGG